MWSRAGTPPHLATHIEERRIFAYCVLWYAVIKNRTIRTLSDGTRQMKISLSWVFDHINAPRVGINVEQLIERFNKTTAEIEGWQRITFPLQELSVAQVIELSKDSVTLISPEWQRELTLPIRPDAARETWFLIARTAESHRWATTRDFGSTKEALFAPVMVNEPFSRGQWKDKLEAEDYILEVDNKSITHRPDMWGHRGFAREIAALYDLPLIPISELCASAKMHKAARQTRINKSMPFSISIDTPNCSRFAAIYLQQVDACPTLLWTAHRLCRVDGKPISALVDGTNYAMLDIGHPMHAFDADKVGDTKIVIRNAHDGEQLTLLDDEEINLMDEDIVIANNNKPLSLAGVMGGKSSSVTSQTTAVLLEAACFDATAIRRTSARHKERTDASARFEKSLDANQAPIVLERYLQLMQDAHIIDSGPYNMSIVGKPIPTATIKLDHRFVQKRLGTTVSSEFILDTLSKLGFDIIVEHAKGAVFYQVEIPSFRATKDVTIPEDLVEEIGRFVGYDKIPAELPLLQLAPTNTKPLDAIQNVKHLLANGLQMQELYTYPLYDESFLRTINYTPHNPVTIENPVSENWLHMITSLVPNMLKAVDENCQQHDDLRFFEMARVWHIENEIVERKQLAGIFFEKKNEIDFFKIKQLLHALFVSRGLTVAWHKIDRPEHPWLSAYTSATLSIAGHPMGYAGLVDPAFLHQITDGNAFVFELDASILASYEGYEKKFSPLPKYPDVSRDLSILAPTSLTTDQLQSEIVHVDQRITNVSLVDFFEKKEWEGKKAMTFRLTIRDETKTMTTAEIDAIHARVAAALKKQGAGLR